MLTGALVAGIGWEIVQILGTYFVAHVLRGAPEAYGVFGLVLGLIAWIYLLALVIVFAVEVNVVGQRRLWPRALLTPFTDRVRLTSADERAYTGYAESERHKGFEVWTLASSRGKRRRVANPGAGNRCANGPSLCPVGESGEECSRLVSTRSEPPGYRASGQLEPRRERQFFFRVFSTASAISEACWP